MHSQIYSNCISLSIFDTDIVVHTNSLRSIKHSDVWKIDVSTILGTESVKIHKISNLIKHALK